MTEEQAGWIAFAARALLKPDLAELREAAPGEELAAALGDDRLELEREHVRLFLNPAGAPCPPWQSAHADPPELMGEAHASALEWYRSEGVEPVAPGEPADHAGLLLAFYAHLVERGAPAERLRAFEEQHLAWLPAFFEAVARESRHPFYCLLAKCVIAELR